MKVSREKENFFRLLSLLNSSILPQLRTLFKDKWKNRFPLNEWCDLENQGKELLKMIKGGRKDNLVKERISKGRTDGWDLTCLFKALSALGMDDSEKESIEKLKEVRNSISHYSSGECDDDSKNDICTNVKSIYGKFGWPEQEVDDIQYGTLTTEDMEKLKLKLEEEKKAALEEQQENFCKLPPELGNFVGRDEPLKRSYEALEFDSEDKFVLITGGPCYGKSSLAIKVGYDMYERGYSYVVWINMRDITKTSSCPTLESVALNILQKFNIDTQNMMDDIVEYLKRKLKMITDCRKTALLIFDNADDLIQPEKDDSCRSSSFAQLCQLIRDNSRNSIRAIFTSRVCEIDVEGEHQVKVNLGYLLNDESRAFLCKEFQSKSMSNKDNVIDDLVEVCFGLPYALKLSSSEVMAMDDEGMINDYVEDLKKNPVDVLDDTCRLTYLFDLSYKRLEQKEKDAFKSLAVFPSGFSYSYLSKFGKNLDNINVRPKILQKLIRHSLIISYEKSFLIHPFLRDFLQKQHWNEDLRAMYERAYYKTYILQLFALARNSLEKDKFSECLKEFRDEEQNFVHVLAAIGRGLESCPSYLKDTVKELLTRPTSDFITVSLFYCHELYLFAAIEFFKGCETFVEGQMKKNIWCCRFDINMTIYGKKIDDDYSDEEPDDFGKALFEKRKLAILKSRFVVEHEFAETIESLDSHRKWADTLSDSKVRDYFLHKLLKTKVIVSKKAYKCKKRGVTKETLVRYLEEALDICEKSFGNHGLTVDCHTQLGKLHWFFHDEINAKKWFESALKLAESLSAVGFKRYLACLVDKGRLLVESKDECEVDEGRQLLEDGLERCENVCDEIIWLLAIQSLVTVDKTKVEVIIKHCLEKKRLFLPSLKAMYSALHVALYSPCDDVNIGNFIEYDKSTVEKLRRVINHLEMVSDQSREDGDNLLQDERTQLFLWNMMIARTYMHVLTESDTKEYASKALTMMKNWEFIRKDKREELSFILHCDESRYKLMQKLCHFDQMAKRIPSLKNQQENDYANLLQSCEQYQDVWLWVVRRLIQKDKSYYQKVIPYLLTQSEPVANLLKLVTDTFFYHMNINKRESSKNIIEEERRTGVKRLLSAIRHVEPLVNSGKDSVEYLQDALKSWYTNLAIKSRGILSEPDRQYYARQALKMIKENDEIVKEYQKNILESLFS